MKKLLMQILKKNRTKNNETNQNNIEKTEQKTIPKTKVGKKEIELKEKTKNDIQNNNQQKKRCGLLAEKLAKPTS